MFGEIFENSMRRLASTFIDFLVRESELTFSKNYDSSFLLFLVVFCLFKITLIMQPILYMAEN